MGCHNCLIYTRILIYTGTIFLHGTNIVLMQNSFKGEPMKVDGVRHFSRMQVYFFTCWTFVFQMTYAAFGILCDLKILRTLRDPPKNKSSHFEAVTKLREGIFTIMIWPSSLLVFTYFWAFYVYDRNLFYPEYIDTVITPTCNHIMHTLILPIAVLEVVLYPKRKPESNLWRLMCVFALEAIYVFALFYAHKTTGIWVYPIFGQLDGSVLLPLFLGFSGWISSVVIDCRERIGRRFCKHCVE